MDELAKLGKKRTVLISISILIISIYTIYFYHVNHPGELDTKKIIQQIIRFLLAVGLLFALYKGKKWGRIISLILFSLAAIGGLVAIFTIGGGLVRKVPFMVMVFIYSYAIIHFGFSNSYRAFYNYQNHFFSLNND